MADSSFKVLMEFNQSRKPITATHTDLLFKIEQHLGSLGSATGYGGYMVEHENLVANGLWSPDEAGLSSTWRELRAVKILSTRWK